MILGIDASNIRAGGGVTHLVELLRAARPSEYGFDQVMVWGGETILCQLEGRPWLRKVHEPLLDRALPVRLFWQRFILDRLAHRAGCTVLFIPGGSYTGSFRPFVTMSQNMLPFELSEARRFGLSWPRLRYQALFRSQYSAFARASGVMFLSQYAYRIVKVVLRDQIPDVAVIPHGIDGRFLLPPRPQMSIQGYSQQRPYRILYVSIVNLYKHQWHVAEAVAILRRQGLPVQLDLIGPAYPPALRRLHAAIHTLDPNRTFIRYRGAVPHAELAAEYRSADLFVFASSCENLPNILIEAMASGLPIACSNCGPMPEVLGDAGLYFDPEQPMEIADCLRKLINDPVLRDNCASAAYERATQYSWRRCADETFAFLAQIAREEAVCQDAPSSSAPEGFDGTPIDRAETSCGI